MDNGNPITDLLNLFCSIDKFLAVLKPFVDPKVFLGERKFEDETCPVLFPIDIKLC